MAIKADYNRKWERKLNICTGAGDYEKDDANHSRYEPTAYKVLERLAESGYLDEDSIVVDYGCGKGRAGFFLNYALHCKTIGIEYDESLYADAMENLAQYAGKNKDERVSFLCVSAENYAVKDADCFYFFNPFSVKILQSVLGKILESYYENPRKMLLFFYYALDDWISCLMAEDALQYEGDIDCRDLFFNEDSRERIMVFSIGQ